MNSRKEVNLEMLPRSMDQQGLPKAEDQVKLRNQAAEMDKSGLFGFGGWFMQWLSWGTIETSQGPGNSQSRKVTRTIVSGKTTARPPAE